MGDKRKKKIPIPNRALASIRATRYNKMWKQVSDAKKEQMHEEDYRKQISDLPLLPAHEEPSELEQSILNHMDFSKFDKGHN